MCDIMERKKVTTSTFSSSALFMAPERYCMEISSIAVVFVFIAIRSAARPLCFEERAAAIVFGT